MTTPSGRTIAPDSNVSLLLRLLARPNPGRENRREWRQSELAAHATELGRTQRHGGTGSTLRNSLQKRGWAEPVHTAHRFTAWALTEQAGAAQPATHRLTPARRQGARLAAELTAAHGVPGAPQGSAAAAAPAAHPGGAASGAPPLALGPAAQLAADPLARCPTCGRELCPRCTQCAHFCDYVTPPLQDAAELPDAAVL
jgi:hypothetical protein